MHVGSDDRRDCRGGQSDHIQRAQPPQEVRGSDKDLAMAV